MLNLADLAIEYLEYTYIRCIFASPKICIMEEIIGRKDEIRRLTDYYNSGKAEFIAIYGRRRIGI